MKNLVSGYSKTVVSHCRGCIFQGFQSLQKVEKTTPEIVSKWYQNPLKSGSEGSPKRSLKVQWKIMKNWWKKVSKMRSTKRVFLLILGTFLSSGSKGVPGCSQGPSQGPSRVKFAPKWVSKWFENHQKSYLQAFWKRFSKTRALSMFPNSSGLFLVCSYSCRGRFCVTFIQVKSRHSSTWLGGKTYGGFPLLPDVSKIAPNQDWTPKRSFDFFVTWKSDSQKWSQSSQNGVPNWLKIDQKSIKCWL